jgi:Spy/CpxP family protein refolding chaperone
MYAIQRQKLGALTIFLLITFFSGPAIAGSFTHGDRHDEGFGMKEKHTSACGLWRNPETVEKLGLSDKQITELKNADFTFRKQQLELKAQLDILHLEMEKAFSDKTPEEATVHELAGKMADVKGKLFIQNIESRLTAAKCLTADQMKKIQADYAQHHGGRTKDKHHDMALYGNEKGR